MQQRLHLGDSTGLMNMFGKHVKLMLILQIHCIPENSTKNVLGLPSVFLFSPLISICFHISAHVSSNAAMALAVAKLAVATHLLGLVQGFTRIVHQQYWSTDVPSQSSQPPKRSSVILSDVHLKVSLHFWGVIYAVQKSHSEGWL